MFDHHFPEEIVIEILTRLPVKSLARFTAVSKSWRVLITSTTFISGHRHHSRNGNPSTNLLLLRRFDKCYREEKYSIINDIDNQLFNLNDSSELGFPIKCTLGYFRVVGCCNGVVCSSDDYFNNSHAITLWNPCIRKLRILPLPTIKPALPYFFVLGFAVNPQSDGDLKVVRVVYERKGEFLDTFAIPPEVEIYSLNTGLWRRITVTGINYYMVDFTWNQAVVNGAIHWIGYRFLEDGEPHGLIAAFIMTDELFSEITLPNELAKELPIDLSVMVLGESVAVARYSREMNGHGGSCELWIMKEYGVVESWTRLHSIELVRGMEKIVGFRKNGEVLFSTSQGELVSYCPNTGVINNLGIFGNGRSFYVEKYLESLVLIQEQRHLIDELHEQMLSMQI